MRASARIHSEDRAVMVVTLVSSSEFSPEEINAKLAEIGLTGRGIVPVDETCGKLACSKSYYYDALAGRELRHIRISEKVVGTYARDLAILLLKRERDPLPVRIRGKKKAAT
jgi:hypothetical protein